MPLEQLLPKTSAGHQKGRQLLKPQETTIFIWSRVSKHLHLLTTQSLAEGNFPCFSFCLPLFLRLSTALFYAKRLSLYCISLSFLPLFYYLLNSIYVFPTVKELHLGSLTNAGLHTARGPWCRLRNQNVDHLKLTKQFLFQRNPSFSSNSGNMSQKHETLQIKNSGTRWRKTETFTVFMSSLFLLTIDM